MTRQEALRAIHETADELDGLTAQLDRQPAETTPAGLAQALRDAADRLRGAAGAFVQGEPRAAPSSVPVGATPPGVVIVGSGNTAKSSQRIVGASW